MYLDRRGWLVGWWVGGGGCFEDEELMIAKPPVRGKFLKITSLEY